MKIAILGLRSIGPESLGGIEKVVEELSVRYVKAGHEVTVFVRARYARNVGEDYEGVRLKALPAIYTKHLEAITNTVAAILYSLRGFDVIHINALGPALLAFIPRLFGKKVVVTIHGQDWKREKWSRFASWVLRIGERAAVYFPQRTIVVSRTLKNYEKEKFGKDVVFIPNGVVLPEIGDAPVSNQLGLGKNEFVLFLSRLVPEKGCHDLIKAFQQLNTTKKLVIAGAPSHSQSYADQLRKLAADDDRIVFAGPLYGEKKDEAFRNACFFVLPSTIEGMAIVLLEAMGYGKCCLCSDIDENLEVIFPFVTNIDAKVEATRLLTAPKETPPENMFGSCFRSGNVEDLASNLKFLFENEDVVEILGNRARNLVADRHNWDRIAQEHLSVYAELVA